MPSTNPSALAVSQQVFPTIPFDSSTSPSVPVTQSPSQSLSKKTNESPTHSPSSTPTTEPTSSTPVCSNNPDQTCSIDGDCWRCVNGNNDGQLCSAVNCWQGGGSCDETSTCDSGIRKLLISSSAEEEKIATTSSDSNPRVNSPSMLRSPYAKEKVVKENIWATMSSLKTFMAMFGVFCFGLIGLMVWWKVMKTIKRANAIEINAVREDRGAHLV